MVSRLKGSVFNLAHFTSPRVVLVTPSNVHRARFFPRAAGTLRHTYKLRLYAWSKQPSSYWDQLLERGDGKYDPLCTFPDAIVFNKDYKTTLNWMLHCGSNKHEIVHFTNDLQEVGEVVSNGVWCVGVTDVLTQSQEDDPSESYKTYAAERKKLFAAEGAHTVINDLREVAAACNTINMNLNKSTDTFLL